MNEPDVRALVSAFDEAAAREDWMTALQIASMLAAARPCSQWPLVVREVLGHMSAGDAA